MHERVWKKIEAFVKPETVIKIHHEETENGVYSSDHGVDDEEELFNRDDNFVARDDMLPLVHDATNVIPESVEDNAEDIGSHKEVPKEFHRLLADAEAELYPDCKIYTRLEFIVTLLHIKALQSAFNIDENFPENCYEARKYSRAFGLDYVKIDACINHCTLYWKDNEALDKCPKCHASRWKEMVNLQGENHNEMDYEGRAKVGRVPQLVLRHFLVVPRLQRMFMSSKLVGHR